MLELPVLLVMGTRAKRRQLEAAATALSQGDEADIEMGKEALFKTPKEKRLQRRRKKLPKKGTETESDSDGYISDSVMILTVSDSHIQQGVHTQFLSKDKKETKY